VPLHVPEWSALVFAVLRISVDVRCNCRTHTFLAKERSRIALAEATHVVMVPHPLRIFDGIQLHLHFRHFKLVQPVDVMIFSELRQGSI